MYLHSKSILNAYQQLAQLETKNASILHIFFILKGINVNNKEFVPNSVFGDAAHEKALNMSLLYGPNEIKPEKYDFINPFSMSNWASQAPSETLHKWVSSRIKNNIIGGATTWRKIINEDVYNNKFKFTYNYVDEVNLLTLGKQKINALAFAIWYCRFFSFTEKSSPKTLIETMFSQLNLTEYEIGVLFERSMNISIDFSENMPDHKLIREQIGKPKNFSTEWMDLGKRNPEDSKLFSESNYKTFNMKSERPSLEKIESLLKTNYQIVLSGPPGTSKSHIAEKVSNSLCSNSDNIFKIQFHPQYTYQDFIGGFIVEGDKVLPNKGVFMNIIDKSKKSSENFVLIIDEINRANVSSVFGETIQCLDRKYKTTVKFGGDEISINIPKNLLIIATMNTADRTLGNMDFALRRRFANVYVGPDENELIDLCESSSAISFTDVLKTINTSLRETLKNNELVIGQTVFYNEEFLKEDKFVWDDENFEDLFNYKILPIIEEYCNDDSSKICQILGDLLPKRLTGDEFIQEINNLSQ